MAELQRIPDMVAGGLALRMSQYANSPNIEALLTALLTHQQTIEDALFALRDGRFLANATGATLNGLGELVGIDRNGLDDGTYRVLVYAKIAENNGDATLQNFITVCRALFNAQALWQRTPLSVSQAGLAQGAFIAVMVGSPRIPSSLYRLIVKLLQQSLPAGVDLAHLGTFQAAKAFAFAGNQPWVGGFGSTKDPKAGAPMASLVYNSPY